MLDVNEGVNTRSPASTIMKNKAQTIRDLMGGTARMRLAGKIYLPQNKKEKDASYAGRLNQSWLFNGTRQTIRDMTGYVFDVPIILEEGTPDNMVEWSKDIDMQNTNLNNFAVDLFKDGMQTGISYIMVDAPRREGGETRADEAIGGLRPFMSIIRNEDVLGVRTGQVRNQTVLTQIRIAERVEEISGKFKTKTVEQVRVIDRDESIISVTTYREDKKTGYWVVHEEEYVIEGIDEITIAPFYANRTGFFKGEPLLEDLADVNIAHWQSQSDQRNILHVARVPILFGSGIPSDEEIIVSAERAVTTSNESASLGWVELQGNSISSGRQDLKDLEFQMEVMGLQLLVQRVSGQSATGESLDAKKETSQLTMMAMNLEDCLETAFGWMHVFSGTEGETNVTVNKEFGIASLAAHEFSGLLTAVNTGNLTRRSFLDELKRRTMLSEKLDVDAELDELDEQDLKLDIGAADNDDDDDENGDEE